MSCDKFERLIALDAGGDLTPEEGVRVQAHLETCAPCRELARALSESQAALRSLAEDDLDDRALAAWGTRFRRPEPAAPRRWRWAWAAAAAMALLAAPLLLRQAPPVPPPPVPIASLAPPPVDLLPQRQKPPRRHVRHRPQPAVSSEPLLVKLETSDPNVVIYWIVERKRT